MQILLLNQFYPPDVAPTGQVLHDLARVLVGRGHQVRVVCSRRSYDGGQRFPARETLDGVEVLRLPALGFGRRGFLGKFADYSSFSGTLLWKLAFLRPRPDLILALTTPPYVGFLAKLAARWCGTAHAHWIMDLYPDVMAAHGTLNPRRLLFRALRRLTRTELRGARLVLALGPHMSTRVAPYLNDLDAATVAARLRWMPLWGTEGLAPWPEAEPVPLRAARGWGSDEMVLLYSGNMGLGHRLGEFLAAAERLGSSGPRWAFAGGGKRRAEVEAFARGHPQARIDLLPYAPRERLREHHCSADVHLVSLDSAWQGLIAPSKLQASFCVGKPAILVGSKENEAAQWITESGGGWLVPEDDIEELLTAISQASDPVERRRRGGAARAFAERHFQMRTNCEQIAEWVEACVR